MRSVMILGLSAAVAALAIPAVAQDCSLSRSNYISAKSVPLADVYIGCLEGGVIAVASGGGWTPTPMPIGGGVVPKGPTFDELQEYLKWLRETYDITAQEMSAAAVPAQTRVIYNQEVVILPMERIQGLRPGDEVSINELNTINPGIFNELRVDQLRDVYFGPVQ